MAEEQPEGEVPMAKRWEPPPPVAPVPAAPVPPPPAYAPPAYASPAYPQYSGQFYPPDYSSGQRPGGVTAIGVLSIVLGSLGLLVNLMGGVWVLAMFAMNKVAKVVAAMPPPGVAWTSTTPSPITGYERGLNLDVRQTIAGVLSQLTVHPLNAARQQQLDALLERNGKDMIPLPEGQYNPARIRKAIEKSGEQPAVEDGAVGQQYFVTAAGRIELLDDRGDFQPVDGGDLIRVAVPTNPGGAPAPPTVNPALASQAYATSTAAGGGTNAAGPTTVPVMPRFITIDPDALRLSMIETIASFGLAIYLLVIGILAVRSSRAAGRLHLVYALIKIPLVIFMVIVWSRVMSGVWANMRAGGPRPPPGPTDASAGVVWLALGLAYPIAVLIVLRLRSVRDYYHRPR